MLDVVRRATTYRKKSEDLRPLVVFPLVSRIELSEQKLHEAWRFGNKDSRIDGYQPQLQTLFAEVYDLPVCDLKPYFDVTGIQYVPYFAFGEQIAVLDEKSTSRLSLTTSYEFFTDLLVGPDPPWRYPSHRVRP